MTASVSRSIAISNVRLGLASVATLLCLMQAFMHSDSINIESNCLALLSFLAGVYSIVRQGTARHGKAFTGVVVLAIISANSIVPVTMTLIEGSALSKGLEEPLRVFFHRVIFSGVLIGSHYLAGLGILYLPKRGLGDVWRMLGAQSILSRKSVWFVSLSALAIEFVKIIPGLQGSSLMKGLDISRPFCCFVYVLLIPPYVKGTLKNNIQLAGIFLYYVCVCSLGVKSRMVFVAPFATIVFGWLVAFLAGQATLNLRLAWRLSGIAILVLLLMGQLRDISSAILKERALRDVRSSSETFVATFNSFVNKTELHEFEMSRKYADIGFRYGMWDESFIEDPFMGRFISIKLDDNIFVRSDRLNSSDVENIRHYTWDKILAILPSPILNGWFPDVDKDFVNSFSMADYIDWLGGRYGFLGGFKTGSFIGHGYIVFGWMYPFIIGFFLFICFFFLQSMACRAGNICPSFVLFYTFPVFLTLGFEGFHTIFSLVCRNMWQSIFAYGLMVWLSNQFDVSRKVSRV